jgi:two-component system, NarL family, nitrate/nitrite response regulator NarL
MASRILVADDHQAERENLRSAFKGEAVEFCGEAGDGEEAVDRAKELKPDLVLLDVSMPVMNGLEAAYEIRRAIPSTKIVFFSVEDSLQVSAAARLIGADAFISKPSTKELVSTVRRLLKTA